MGPVTFNDVRISFIGHATFKFNTKDLVIYTDPYKLPDNMLPADLILVSHGHYDHCAPEEIEKISKVSTIVIASADAKRKLSGNVQVMGQNDRVTIKSVTIRTVPAYNTTKPYHPRGTGVGFIIDTGKTRIYFAGDTDYTVEMESLKSIDVCLVPIGGTYTMDEKEAADFINRLKPKIAVPMHYGSVTAGDPLEFKKRVDSPIDVEIMK